MDQGWHSVCIIVMILQY